MGSTASSMFDIGNPSLDWVEIAEGMGVEATSVSDVPSLAAALKSAFAQREPRLIEAVM
jgi:acetolactate synthase I/II/III large subunit